jgi:hypothetical protein
MAGVHEPNVIDLVAMEADGTALLVIVEERPWGSDPSHPGQLREKFNTYAWYVLDGLLVDHYPELVDQPVTIRLECVEPPKASSCE